MKIIIIFFLNLPTWFYFIILLQRTDFGTGITNIDSDTIIIMYTVSLIAFFCSLIIAWNHKFKKILLIFSLIPLLGFSYLNLSGKADEFFKKNTGYWDQQLKFTHDMPLNLDLIII